MTPIRAFAAYGSIGEESVLRQSRRDAAGSDPGGFPNFGECLFAGIEGMLAAGCSSACVLNADTPDLPTEYLVSIARELAGGRDRVVIGPADDGGYYILGIARPHRRLFDDIDWSTERVFAQTLARAGELGLEVVTLPMWSDIDDAAIACGASRAALTRRSPQAERGPSRRPIATRICERGCAKATLPGALRPLPASQVDAA